MFDKLLPEIVDGVISASGSVPVVIEGIEHTYDTSASLPEISYHNSHELLYLREGRIDAVINGETISLDKGKILIIRPLVKHKITIKSRKADMFNLYFGFVHDVKELGNSAATDVTSGIKNNSAGPTVMIPGSMAQIPLENFLQFADLGITEDNEMARQPFFLVNGSEKKEISILAEQIVDEKAGDRYAKEFMIHTLTVELMIHLSRAMRNEWEENLRVKNGKARELVKIARQYMDENFEQGITVAEAAQYVFLSQGYFTRAFKDELGISPMNYLMRKRIEKACELLENNEIKVSSIAVQSGFSSPQRFNVAFRKLMGKTPMEYRKEHMK
ncbi:MAG: helix-turn-helix domain-containing protein [Clostridiales bacterium]|jgi:AraC-like DNA-binding protein|nr:helix-turn-helix domain-containing protein [Clostridiales bacterium]MBR6211133.1 helix-turn-helix domain-containing protein [Clostridiales bacterium]